jgi:hypothetical protein
MFRRLRGRVGRGCWGGFHSDMSLTIGDRGRWWNRSLPMGRILLVSAGVILCGWIGWMNWRAVDDLAWGTRHDWRARLHGGDVKVPHMWRQVAGSYDYHELSLERAQWWSPWTVRRIDLNLVGDGIPWKVPPNRWPMMVEGQVTLLRRLATEIPGGKYLPPGSKGNPDLHYECAQFPFGDQFVHFMCYSTDGRLSADLLGDERDIEDFRSILIAFTDPKYHQDQ